jgi:hypothetical protein
MTADEDRFRMFPSAWDHVRFLPRRAVRLAGTKLRQKRMSRNHTMTYFSFSNAVDRNLQPWRRDGHLVAMTAVVH